MPHPPNDLARNLRNRHIQLIAIGGTIGVGLFLGSAKAIHDAGPGLLLAYALGGVAIFFIMRALGELLTYRPVAGSFATYAEEFCGPLAGFVTGWSYWFMWVVIAMAELTAIGIYVRYWFPDLPQWLPALIALARALRHEPAGGARLRRARVLVRAHQGRDHRRLHCRRARRDLFPPRRARCHRRLCEPLCARRLPALWHRRACC